ncbi:MAG: hypothetical protein WBR29_01050 [Gammaproteobacteria bacterium]
MAKWVFYIGPLLVMTACAGTPPAQGTAASMQGKLVCTENSMGYHIHQRICLTPEQVADRKKASEQATQNQQAAPAKSCPAGETSC